MSDQTVRVFNDVKETDSQFMQSHQSVWMSRWKRTSCNSKTEAHNGSPNTLREMELDYTMGDDNCADKLKVSKSVKRHEEIVTKTFEIVNQSMKMSSESLRKEGIEYQDLPMVPPANCGSGFLFKLGQVTDDVEISGCASGYNSNIVKAVACEAEIQFPGFLASKDVLFKKCQHRDEDTSKNPPKWTQSHSSAKDSTSAESKSLWESFVKPSSVTGPFILERQHSEFDDGKTLVPLFIGRSAIISSNQLLDANLRLGQHEYQHNHKVDSHSQPWNSVTVCFMESNTSSLLQKNKHVKGAVSTPSKKAIYMDCNSPRQASVASSKQGAAKRPNIKLPDITVDLCPLPATVAKSENGDPLSPVANPGNRCVKRLKLSSSHSTAQGTKSSSKDEPSIQEELNKNFVAIYGSAVICSEPTLTKAQGKDQYFSVDPPEKDQELLLSHAWIKRWRRNGSSSTKDESSTVVFCVPRSSNLTLKGFQNERFPSIAAMALMGRAMSCFQPCQLQKRGCLTVWNSRAL